MIKFLAVFFMLIDHIGHFLYPDMILLRVIGRLALPLFAYSFAVGLSKSENLDRYFQRIFTLAFFVHVSLWFLGLYIPSILATFLLAGFAIRSCNRFFIILALIIAHSLPGFFDYGAYGIALIYIMYLHCNIWKTYKYRNSFLLLAAHFFLPLVAGMAFPYVPWYQLFSFSAISLIIFFADVSPFLLPRWFYYHFYYFHLIILGLLYNYKF